MKQPINIQTKELAEKADLFFCRVAYIPETKTSSTNREESAPGVDGRVSLWILALQVKLWTTLKKK